jgi:hypothetical protein
VQCVYRLYYRRFGDRKESKNLSGTSTVQFISARCYHPETESISELNQSLIFSFFGPSFRRSSRHEDLDRVSTPKNILLKPVVFFRDLL